MNLYKYVGLMLVVTSYSMASEAQSVQVNQQNRTIEIAASSSLEVTADRVTITVGYHNYGRPTRLLLLRMRESLLRYLKHGKMLGFRTKISRQIR